MEDFFAVTVVAVLCVFSMVGLTHIVGDYRHFDDIAAQCKSQGYIQDKTTRILCSVEGGK